MAEPAAEAALGWPQEVFDEFDSNLPLQHQFYTRILDAQAAAEADKLHPSQLPLNAGLAAPAARVVQRAQGTSQRLPDLAEECLAPMLGQRGSVAVVEPRGQQADGRRARKRQRGQAAAAGSTFRGPSYSGRYNIHPSGPGEVPLIAKRETTLTRTIDALTQQFAVHEVQRVVLDPSAVELKVKKLHLHESGHTELCLEAGGDSFTGSTQLVLVSGLPTVEVARKNVDLNGRYRVNPAGCGEREQPDSHFKIKLPKKAAAAAAAAIEEAVRQGRVTVKEDYKKDDSVILHHFMLQREQQQQPEDEEEPQQEGEEEQPPPPPPPPPQQQQQQPAGLQIDFGDDFAGFEQVLDGTLDFELLDEAAQGAGHGAARAGSAAVAEEGSQHIKRLTVGGPAPAAGRGEFAGSSLVVQGRADVTGELYTRGQLVTSDTRAKERIRAFDEAEKSVSIVSELCAHLFEYKGTGMQRLGLMAQQVRAVLERHEAEGLNIVREGAQGMLAIDYAALQTLLLSSLQSVLRDQAELRDSQGAFQLAVMGRLERLSLAAQQVGAAGGGLSVLLRGSGSGGSGGNAARFASLEQLLASDSDEEMATSEGSGGQEEEEGQGQEDEGELRGLSEVQAAQWLMDRLSEQAGSRGIYTKLAGDLSPAALWETYREALAAPQELVADGSKPRSLGGTFIKLAKKRVQAEKLRRKGEAEGATPVRLRGYQQRMVEEARGGGNWIFVAPTNSGKTAVAKEHAAHVLGQGPQARVVFVTPTVALATQQAGERGGGASFSAHPGFGLRGFSVGCFTSDSPIAPRDWRKTLEEHRVLVLTPQILVNALDAGEAHFSQIALLVLDECHHATGNHAVNQLLRHYHASQERTQVLGLTATPASKASLHATLAGMRELARNLAAQYRVVAEDDQELLSAVPDIEQEEVLVQLEPADDGLARRLGGFVVAAVERLREGLGLPDVPGLPKEVAAMLQLGGWSAAVLRWARAVAEQLQGAVLDGRLGAASPALHDATTALGLVRAATAALALVSDVGFEAAVRHLSGEYFAAAAKVAPTAGSGAVSSSGAVASDGPLTAALLAQLAEVVTEAGVLEGTFSGMARHPKFKALLSCLSEAAGDRDSWHAIVFARTREAVRTLAAMLQDHPQLQGVQVHALMGHASGAAAGGGMSSKQQQAALDAFRQLGRHLLVSTAAGEEGIDVPRCELVVRYAAAQTGRERLQSAGRARKHGSRFVEITSCTAAELALVRKAWQEEEHLRAALQSLSI